MLFLLLEEAKAILALPLYLLSLKKKAIIVSRKGYVYTNVHMVHMGLKSSTSHYTLFS